MSAECSKCGSDLVYPPGSWPVGTCEPCDLRAALAAAEAERDALKLQLVSEHDGLRKALEGPIKAGVVSALDAIEAICHAADAALVSSGSGGPGVHLTTEDVAQAFHEAYERSAPEFGYETRAESAVPWDAVPEPNRSLMVAVAGEVLALLRPAVRGGGQADTEEVA